MNTRLRLIVSLLAVGVAIGLVAFYSGARSVAHASGAAVHQASANRQAPARALQVPDPAQIKAVSLTFGLGLSIRTLEQAALDADDVQRILSNAQGVPDPQREELDGLLVTLRRERIRQSPVNVQQLAPEVIVALDQLLTGLDPTKASEARRGALEVLSGATAASRGSAARVQPNAVAATARGGVSKMSRETKPSTDRDTRNERGRASTVRRVSQGEHETSEVSRTISSWCVRP
jgi:hypothetical protein